MARRGFLPQLDPWLTKPSSLAWASDIALRIGSRDLCRLGRPTSSGHVGRENNRRGSVFD